MGRRFITRAVLVFALCAGVCGSVEARSWRDYEIIMWQPQTSQQYATSRELGITAGTVELKSADRPGTLPMRAIDPLIRNHLRWYVENIATDFYSPYHRWFPDHPVNWRFEAVKKRYDGDPLDRSALTRDPSLSDPKWLAAVRARLIRTVRAQRVYRPLYYDLGDETGIADLSVFWDFDVSDESLRGFHDWLARQYGRLVALNAEWGSHFTRWRDVRPMTTREAIAGSDENFAAWADFKEWMDVAFARAIRLGHDAVHAADPDAYAGLEGGQIPGWGGYDYSRLAHAIDVMELYDGGGNLEIVRSLNPGMVILTTSSGLGPRAAHDVWREVLRGTRGTILWDPNGDFTGGKADSGSPGLAPTLREIHDWVAPLLSASKREEDPVAVLYSPASMRVQWMLDWKPRGDAWSRRDASASYEDPSAVRDSMVGYTQMLEHMGLNPAFLTSSMIAHGQLASRRDRVLILPHAIALDEGAARKIREFTRRGGVVIADVEPGLFDRHGRKRLRPVLADLFGDAMDMRALYVDPDVATCARALASDGCQATMERLRRLLEEAAVRPKASITNRNGGRAIDCTPYFFRHGATTIIALQREGTTVSEQPTGRSELGEEDYENVTLTMPQRAYVFDLRKKLAIGRRSHMELSLDPVEPTILLVSPTRAIPSDINPLLVQGRRRH